jgi:FAD/FMN-containing dehydrogenase
LLAGLNQVLHIDAAARKAIVQPVVSNRDLLAALQPHGLAFPSQWPLPAGEGERL